MDLVDWVLLAMGAPEPTDPATGGTPGGGGMNLMLPVMLVGIVLIFWMMGRRNKKQQGKVEDFRSTLTIGTRVLTLGGMIGVVSDIQGDVVTLRSPSGDETAYTKRAIREAVTDEMWAAMIEPVGALDDVLDEDEPEESDLTETDQPETGESEDPTK